jgi:spore coat protein U-like protein
VKKLLAIAIASTAIASAPAFAAESDSNSFDVTATVQPECSIEDPDNVAFGNIAINQDPGASALTINQQFHNNNQSLWVSCNYGAKMTISSQNGFSYARLCQQAGRYEAWQAACEQAGDYVGYAAAVIQESAHKGK